MYTDERLAQVCLLGPVEAFGLAEQARGGDLQALKDWAVRAAYMRMRRLGLTPNAALESLRLLLPRVKMIPKLVP